MIVLYVLAFIFILSPFLPAFPNPHWFFRTADFIIIQSLIIQIELLALVAALVDLFDIQDLYISKMERSENYGSDHFAMYYEIYHKTGAATDTNGEITTGDQKDIDDGLYA